MNRYGDSLSCAHPVHLRRLLSLRRYPAPVAAVCQSLRSQTFGVIKAALVIFTALAFTIGNLAQCAEAGRKPIEKEFLSGFMVGEYDLIGRKPDSQDTYTGKVTLRADGDNLRVTRTIEGKTTKATLRFDTAGPDRIPVLRMRFIQDGVEHEATYNWQSDLDNYPRLTGIIYRPNNKTKSPGLEALFPTHK